MQLSRGDVRTIQAADTLVPSKLPILAIPASGESRITTRWLVFYLVGQLS